MNRPEIPPPKPETAIKANSTSHGVQFNVDEWLPYFDDTDLTHQQKCALIETLFNLVVSIVDLNFKLNPTQTACGEEFDITTILKHIMLDSDTPEKSEFNQTAKEKTPEEARHGKG